MEPGRQRDAERQDGLDEADDGAPGDLGLAPDDAASDSEDERVRRVIDGLLHPGEVPAGPAVARVGRDPAVPADRPGRATVAADELGLCRADAWHRMLEAEHARVARYGTRTTVVQLEIADIGLMATLLGEPAAGRLVRVLAATVREESRGADTWARIGRFRIAGLLPQTDGRTADRSIGRIQDGFRQRLGGRLPVALMAGRAEINAELTPAATLARAEGSLRPEARGPAETGRGAGPSAVGAVAQSEGVALADGTAPVSDRLRVLAQLHADGLVTDDEYRTTRLEILRRI